ncbi:ATP-dependent Clp protease ATP-binding subunit ClpL [Bienertia sinuspersici]
MNAIPLKYLNKIGGCSNMKVHGETVTVVVDAADSTVITKNHIAEFRSHLEYSNVKVVGVDCKLKTVFKSSQTSSPKKFVLVFYASNRCLIFHSVTDNYSEIFRIMEDPNICFVGPTELLQQLHNHGYYNTSVRNYFPWKSVLVSAGELAARILNKPGLTTTALDDVAQEAGVWYDGPLTGTGTEIQVDPKNPMVLSEEMLKYTINDAVAHYLIGGKLLDTIDDKFRLFGGKYFRIIFPFSLVVLVGEIFFFS